MPTDFLFGALLALSLALLWYGRGRPDFPPDLHYWIRDKGAAGAGAWAPVSQRSFLVALFGLVPAMRIRIRGEDRLLAKLRPVRRADDGLYRLQLRQGVTLSRSESGTLATERRGIETIAVGIDYGLALAGSDRELVFKLGYRSL